jgi:hypothetical protein
MPSTPCSRVRLSWRSSRIATKASCAAAARSSNCSPRNFTNLRKQFSELYRTGLFFSNGRHLTREYPRLTPSGAQVDLFESMDIENGLIVYHRVYWGWQGLKALLAVRDRRT